MISLFIISTWLFDLVHSASTRHSLTSFSQHPVPQIRTNEATQVRLWVNSSTDLKSNWTVITFTDSEMGPLVLQSLSQVYRGLLVLQQEERVLVTVTAGRMPNWEMLVLTLDNHRVILCVIAKERVGECSEGTSERPLPAEAVIFSSLKQGDQSIACKSATVHYRKDSSALKPTMLAWIQREKEVIAALRGKTARHEGVAEASQAIVWTWWARRRKASAELHFAAKINLGDAEEESFSLVLTANNQLTSHCLDLPARDCSQSDALKPKTWYFMKIEVLFELHEVRFCRTDLHEEITDCQIVELKKSAHLWTFLSVNYGNSHSSEADFHDFRLWTITRSPDYLYANYESVFDDSKEDLMSQRRLQSTHQAVFSHTVDSALASNFFSFQNTHLSTQTMVISAVTTGPVALECFLNYMPAQLADWTASGTDSCSITIAGAVSGAYTVNLLVSLGVSAQVTITIACIEITSACYCGANFYPSPDTSNCSPCSASDYQCKSLSNLACLPTDIGLTAPSGGFSCENCPAGQYGSSATGLCVVCDSTCVQCVGPSINDCYSCHNHAELSTSATPSACICSSGYYPNLDAAACTLCDVRCTQCSGAGNNNCSACSSHAFLTGTTCECDIGFGYSASGCLTCPGLCATCVRADITQCLTCGLNAIVATPPGSCICQSNSYVSSSTTCSSCSSKCGTCSGPLDSQCLSCLSNASLTSTPPSACQCDSAFFPSPDPSNCLSCDSTCVLCTSGGLNGCSVCETHAYLVGGACVCNASRFFSSSTLQCELCDTTCQACSDSTVNGCTVCFSNAVLSSGTPPSSCTCSTAYYGSPNACLSCNPLCQTCAGPSSTQCLSCYTSAALAGTAPTSCVCVDGTYLNTVAFTCSPCALQCYTCLALSSNQCVLCPSNSYRTNTAVSASSCSCNSGYYPSPTVANCQNCVVTCKTCSGGAATNCLSCFSNTSLSSGVCSCKLGFFGNPNESNCSACDSTCATCVTSTTNCLTCKPYASISGTQCVCNTNAYPSTTAANCVLCHYTCSSCSSGLINNCLSCFANAVLTALNKCDCLPHYFPSPAANNCLICNVSCLTCSGSIASLCLTCYPNAYLGNGSAPSNCYCNGGFYNGPNASNCLACSNTCRYCNGPNANNCTSSCKANASLASGVCTCLSAYYRDASGDCQLCHISCLTCSGPTASDCLTCSQPGGTSSSAIGGICTCADPINNPCYTCVSSTCLTCNGPTVADCLTCYPNAYKTGPLNSAYNNSGRCICNVSYFGVPNNCQPCDITCYWCTGPAVNQCTNCYGNNSLVSGACVCKQTYFPNPTSKNCALCHTSCLVCQNALASTCTSCFTNAVLASGTSPNTCICSTGYYTVTTSRNCLQCDPTCLTCSGSDVAQCTSCKPNAALSSASPSSCLCSTGYYFNTSTSQCALCYVSCATCSGAASTNCLTCFSNASLSSGSCSCITGYFPNPDAANCAICDTICYKCSVTSGNCTACYSHASLTTVGSTQTCTCAPSYKPTPDAKNCQPCYFECFSCANTSGTACLSCYSHASIPSGSSMGACTCDQGYFPDSTAVICSACPSVCSACTGLDNCTLCFTGAVTYLTASSQRSCKCVGRYFSNPTAANCTACDNSCALCSGAGPSACTSCGTNTIVSGGQCLCIAHYYHPAGTANCSVCDSTCVACSGAAASCTQCYTHAQLASTSPSACICSPGFYAFPSSANCVPCEIMCTQCTGIGLCSTCIANASVAVAPGVCVCNVAYFYISASNTCVSCFPGCKTCSERLFNNCLSCFSNAQLANGSCSCLSGYFASPNSSNCQACNSNCVTCTAGGNGACTLCGISAALVPNINPGTCLCNAGFWPNPDATHCSLCNSMCFTCVGATTSHCLTCHSNAALVSGISPGSCACNQGFYLIVATSLCGSCNATCFGCVAALTSSCTQCQSNASLISGISPGTCQCNPGFYPNSTPSLCSSCHLYCLTCIAGGSSSCSTCKSNATVSSGVCSCNVYYWSNPDPSACSPCHVTCRTCTNATFDHCLTCKSNASLQSGLPSACLCNGGWYPSPDSSLCLPCDFTCQLCSGGTANDCTGCFSSAIISGGLAVGTCVCLSNYFPNSDVIHCAMCNLSCATCKAASASSCTQCQSNASLISGISPGTCQCNPGFYPNSTPALCSPCHLYCLTCIAGGSSSCSTCKSNATVSSGVCSCNVYYWANPDPASCTPCHVTCRTCSNATFDHCLTCKPNASLQSGLPSACICNGGWYPSPDSSLCLPCDFTCQLCSGGTASDCTGCFPSAIISGGLTVGACVCLSNYFPNSDVSHCSICDLSCLSCVSGSAASCTQCQLHGNLIGGVSPGTCECSPGFYPNLTPALCSPCHLFCLTCFAGTSNSCNSCKSNASVSLGSCSCDVYYWANPDPASCTPCHVTCRTCTNGTFDHCLTCKPNASLQSGLPSACICNGGWYPSPDSSLCLPCDFTCQLCSGGTASDCTGCFPSAIISGGLAVGSCVCLSNYFPNSDVSHCSICDLSCLSCVSGSAASCTQCQLHGNLIGGVSPGTCECSPGFYPNLTPALCSPCHLFCLTCFAGTSNSCNSCKSNASVSLGSCSCDVYYWANPDPASCTPCHVTCRTCSNATFDHCLTCKPNASLQSGLHSACICNGGWYPSPDSSLCLPCDFTCQLCSGGTASDCTGCFPSAIISGGLAVGTCICQINYFAEPDVAHCEFCASSCLTCSGGSASECTTCYPHAHLASGLLVSSCICDTSFWPNPHAKFCQPCHFTCLNCLSNSSYLCTECKDFAVVSNPPGSCTCEVSAYPAPDPSSCLPCHSFCLSCVGPKEDQCISCKPGAGVSAPPPTFCVCLTEYFPNPDVSLCQICPKSCLTCLATDICLSCYSNAQLVGGSQCECAQSFYPSPDASSCKPCETNCFFCIETGCLRCISGYYLYKGKCYSTCPFGFGKKDNFECLGQDYHQPLAFLRVEMDNSLTVLFDTPMNFTLFAGDIFIEASTPTGKPISLHWGDPYFVTPQEAAISVTYFDSYTPAGSHITLYFLASELVTSVLGVSLQIASLSGLLYPIGALTPDSASVLSLPVSQQTHVMSTGVVTSSLAASLMVSSPLSFLSTFNQFQLITYLPLSGLQLTGQFSGALAALNAVNMLPNPLVGLLTVENESQHPSAQEENYGLTTALLFPNLVSVATISACVLLSSVPIWLLSKVPNKHVSRYFLRSLAAFKWTVPLNVCFALYLDVAVFSILQVSHTNFGCDYVGVNAAVGYGTLAAVLLLPCTVAIFFFINAHYLVLRNNPSFNSRWRFFFQNFAPLSRWAGIVHFSLFLTRRLLLSSTIFLMRNYPKYFALLNSSCSALIFLYMCILRPYSSMLEKVEALIVESGTLVIYLIAALFAFDWGDKFVSILDQVGVWAVRVVLGLSVALSMVRFANTVLSMTKEYKIKLRSQKTVASHSAHITIPHSTLVLG